MHYDTHYRHNDALHPDALTTIHTALHALNPAVEDCARAGKSPERDAAVLLLARNIGVVADRASPDAEELRVRCMLDRGDVVRHLALTAIAGNPLPSDAAAKRTFHAQARTALRVLAQALNIANDGVRIGTACHGGPGEGRTYLRHSRIEIEVVPRNLVTGHEVGIAAVSPGGAVGKTHWRPIADLLDPEAFARRIEAMIGNLTPPLADAA